MQNSFQALIKNAINSIENGNYLRAKSILIQCLNNYKNNSEIHRLLGVTEALMGNGTQAEKSFRKAISLDKKNSFAYLNLGNIYLNNKNYHEAYKLFNQAIQIDENLDAYNNLAMLNELNGNNEEAIKNYLKILTKKPDHINAVINLSAIYIKINEIENALTVLDKAISIGLVDENILINKGYILSQMREFEKATEVLNQAKKLNPKEPKILINLGNTFLAQKKYKDALMCYEDALRNEPNSAIIKSNIGHLLTKIKKYESAEKLLVEAIEVDPTYVSAWTNLGVCYFEQERYDEAAEKLSNAIKISPSYADAHLNLAHVLLHQKKFELAWREYSWRWSSTLHESPRLTAPIQIWNGEENIRLLIWAEQGIGEQILFSQLFQNVILKKVKAVVLTDKRLIPIFSRTYPELIFHEQASYELKEKFDFQIPMGNLGNLFRSTLSKFSEKNKQRILIPDPHLVDKIRGLIGRKGLSSRKLCGISWISKNNGLGNEKSIKLEDFLPIIKDKNYNFLDLQYSDTDSERKSLFDKHNLDIVKFSEIDYFNDLENMFALIQNCELVITVSNSVAHMAASIGKKTFVLTPLGPGKFWYWASHEGENLWYNNLKCFYQKQQGDWLAPIDLIKDEIIKT